METTKRILSHMSHTVEGTDDTMVDALLVYLQMEPTIPSTKQAMGNMM